MGQIKSIIQRRLPLNVNYTVIEKSYTPILEGGGTICDNCGKLIANVAHVKDTNGAHSYIGFDCLETFLINNQLLSGKDIEEYHRTKKMIPQVIRISKKLLEVIELNKHLNLKEIIFETDTGYGSYTFYWNFERAKLMNDYIKQPKDLDFDFMITTLKAIFPKIEILVMPWQEIRNRKN